MSLTAHETGSGPGRPWLRRLLLLTAALALGALIWRQLPGAGYPTDLTRVGAGTPTLVLAHDGAYLGGAEVMERMNRLRADYAGRIDFLVADAQRPGVAAFVQRHGARDGTVLLFTADGRRVAVLHQPDIAQLRLALDAAAAR